MAVAGVTTVWLRAPPSDQDQKIDVPPFSCVKGASSSSAYPSQEENVVVPVTGNVWPAH